MHSLIIRASIIAFGLLFVVGYIKVLLSENKALEASIEGYKLQSEHNAQVAAQNANQYLELEARTNKQNQRLVELQSEIDKLNVKTVGNEKEIIKYVEKLPEGFERSCLNMSVSDAIRLPN